MLINSFKAFILLLAVNTIIIFIFTIFPFINGLFNEFIGFQKIFNENVSLFIPFLICILPFSFILGFASKNISRKRLLKLAIIGVAGYFITFFISFFSISNFKIEIKDILPMLFLGIYMSIAFAFLFYPLIFISILILNRWTKKV